MYYIKSSKLGAAQIRWLSEIALYDFDIVYCTGNLLADVLSRRPEVESEVEKDQVPEENDEEWIAVSYKVEEEGGHISSTEFNQTLSELVGGTKTDRKLREQIQAIDTAKEKMVGSIKASTVLWICCVKEYIGPQWIRMLRSGSPVIIIAN